MILKLSKSLQKLISFLIESVNSALSLYSTLSPSTLLKFLLLRPLSSNSTLFLDYDFALKEVD